MEKEIRELDKKIVGLVQRLGKICKNKRMTLTTAESCSGGGIAYFITKEPQCSAVLERGFVVYSSQAKESLLKVPSKVLQVSGAASEQVAQSMAEGALKQSIAQVAISTTGIAGYEFIA